MPFTNNKMGAKEKLIGIVLILLGALPLLLKVEKINEVIGQYTFLLPGELLYQIIIVVIGALLLFKFIKVRTEFTRK